MEIAFNFVTNKSFPDQIKQISQFTFPWTFEKTTDCFFYDFCQLTYDRDLRVLKNNLKNVLLFLIIALRFLEHELEQSVHKVEFPKI